MHLNQWCIFCLLEDTTILQGSQMSETFTKSISLVIYELNGLTGDANSLPVGTIYEYATTIECNICKIYLNHVYGMPPTEEQHQKLIEDIRA